MRQVERCPDDSRVQEPARKVRTWVRVPKVHASLFQGVFGVGSCPRYRLPIECTSHGAAPGLLASRKLGIFLPSQSSDAAQTCSVPTAAKPAPADFFFSPPASSSAPLCRRFANRRSQQSTCTAAKASAIYTDSTCAFTRHRFWRRSFFTANYYITFAAYAPFRSPFPHFYFHLQCSGVPIDKSYN